MPDRRDLHALTQMMAIELELISEKNVGLYIRWIEIQIARKSFTQRYEREPIVRLLTTFD